MNPSNCLSLKASGKLGLTLVKVLFDDVFFNLANSGIARVWRSVFNEPSFKKALMKNDIELHILNRSNQLIQFDFPTIDFPEFDLEHASIDRLLLDEIVGQHDFEVFISSYYTFSHNCKSVFVAYDFIPEQFSFEIANRGWSDRIIAIHSATSFLSISNSTTSDLRRFYPWTKSSSVTTCNPGVDTELFHSSSLARVQKFKSENTLEDYFVWVGSREAPYKNAELVFKALLKQHFDETFVFVGGSDFSQKELSAANAKDNRILQLNLDDAALVDCLSGSAGLIYPSLYEGFGIPPVEALAMGKPVITTLNSSLPEAVGDLSCVISGRSPSQLAKALKFIRNPEHTLKIEALGPEWAKQFSWAHFSESVVKSIVDCANTEDTAADARELVREFSLIAQRIKH